MFKRKKKAAAVEAVTPEEQDQKKVEKPISVLGLLFTIVKGLIKSLPKMWKPILLRTVISFVVTTIFSMYSIAVKNQGFGDIKARPGSLWADLTNAGGNEAAFNIICFVLTYLIMILITKIKDKGVMVFVKEIFATIPFTYQCLFKSGKKVIPLLFLTMGLTMSIGVLNKNKVLLITLTITLFFEYASKGNGMVGAFSTAFWNDFHRLFKRKEELKPLAVNRVGAFNLAMLTAMIMILLMPSDSRMTYSAVVMIVFVALGILTYKNWFSKGEITNLIILVVMASVLYKLTQVSFADNGGWREGGSNIISYIGSEGSGAVAQTSMLSGLFSIVGGLLGFALGGVTGSTGGGTYGYEFGGMVGQDISDTVSEAYNMTSDLVHDTLGDGSLMDETEKNIKKDLKKFGEWYSKYNEKFGQWYDSINDKEIMKFNDWLNEEYSDEKIIKMLEDSGEWLKEKGKEGLQDQYEDWKEYLSNPVKYYTDRIKYGADELKANEKLIKMINDKVKDPKTAYDIIREILPINSSASIVDPNKTLQERLLGLGFTMADIATMIPSILTGGGAKGAQEMVEQGVKQGIKKVSKEIGEEAIEQTVKKGTKHLASEAAEKGFKEVAEEVVEKGSKEMAEELVEKGSKEITEEIVEKGSKEMAEEAVQKGAKEGADEIVEKGSKEFAETGTKGSVKLPGKDDINKDLQKNLKNYSSLTDEQKELLIKEQMDYNKKLADAREETQRLIDKVKRGEKLTEAEVLNTRGGINTRALQDGNKIGDLGQVDLSTDQAVKDYEKFVKEYNQVLNEKIHGDSYGQTIKKLGGDQPGSIMRIDEMRTPGKGKQPIFDYQEFRDGKWQTVSSNIDGDGNIDDFIEKVSKTDSDKVRVVRVDAADGINADNDFAVKYLDKDKKVWVEMKQNEYASEYAESFAERTKFTTKDAKEKFPDLEWDGLSKEKQHAQWAHANAEVGVDVYDPEAIRDFSTQPTSMLKDGKPAYTRSTASSTESPVSQLRNGDGDLLDPTQMKEAEFYKYNEPWKEGSLDARTEALEQVTKAGNLLDEFEGIYRSRGKDIPGLKDNFKKGLDIVGDRNLSPLNREMMIKELGFRDMTDFTKKITSRFEYLKLY